MNPSWAARLPVKKVSTSTSLSVFPAAIYTEAGHMSPKPLMLSHARRHWYAEREAALSSSPSCEDEPTYIDSRSCLLLSARKLFMGVSRLLVSESLQ